MKAAVVRNFELDVNLLYVGRAQSSVLCSSLDTVFGKIFSSSLVMGIGHVLESVGSKVMVKSCVELRKVDLASFAFSVVASALRRSRKLHCSVLKCAL